jgi:hypothetical protein
MKPIIFNTEMVKAMLRGQKTQTRRLCKWNKKIENPVVGFTSFTGEGQFSVRGVHESGRYGESFFNLPYKKGDILYVRETSCWVMCNHASDLLEGMLSQIVYKTDVHEDWMIYAKEKYGYKWTPSIHMPKDFARIFLKVKSVKIERLHDISANDVNSEGIGDPIETESEELFDLWEKLWISIYGERSFQSNPWVIVTTFERIENPEMTW